MASISLIISFVLKKIHPNSPFIKIKYGVFEFIITGASGDTVFHATTQNNQSVSAGEGIFCDYVSGGYYAHYCDTCHSVSGTGGSRNGYGFCD